MRYAADVVHYYRAENARKDAIVAAAGFVAALGLWIWLAGAKLRSGTFFLVGLALLWAVSSGREWWRLRQVMLGAETAEEHEARLEANRREVAAHKALLAARRPWMTYGLLTCIALVAIMQVLAHGSSFERAGLVKASVRAGEWWRLLTAALMHGSFMHIWFNGTALLALGAIFEAYAPRARLPLVFLVSALAGNLASLVLLPNITSVGASGGIMGIAGYLLILHWRRPSDMPAWLGKAMLSTIGLTAFVGFFGIAFIDNAAHAGGTAAGAAMAWLTVPRAGDALSPERSRLLSVLNSVSAAVIVGGLVIAAIALLGTGR